MNPEAINKIIETSRITYQARWIYILAMSLTGLITKLSGTSNINFPTALMFAILFAASFYNLALQLSVRSRWLRSNLSVLKFFTAVQFLFDLLIVTLVIHYAGGIESISFIFYFFVLVSASFVYKRFGIYLITIATVIFYNALIYGEYFGILSHYPRYGFSDPFIHLNHDVVFINTYAISLALIACGFFVGYLSYLSKKYEQQAREEKAKRLEEEKSIEEVRRRFITVLTHQFRTPLNHIKLALSGIMEYRAELNPEIGNYLNTGEAALERLLAILERLIKMSDLESKNILEFEKVDLFDITAQCVKNLSFIADYNKVRVDFDAGQPEDIMIKGRPALIRAAIEALLENAIEYSEKDGEVRVALKTDKESAVFSVSDRGLSIKKSDRLNIFNKFFRTDEALRTITDKSGLSLYLAKLIAKKHNGSIWFESDKDGLTTFFLKFPLAGK